MKKVWNLPDLPIRPEPSGYLTERVTEWDSVKGGFMRIVLAFGAIATLVVGLSGCAVVGAGVAVVGAGVSVATTVVGTAADVAGDVLAAPFGGSDDSDKKKKD
jgi:hypothetical protein